jgi:hypothetical protein
VDTVLAIRRTAQIYVFGPRGASIPKSGNDVGGTKVRSDLNLDLKLA